VPAAGVLLVNNAMAGLVLILALPTGLIAVFCQTECARNGRDPVSRSPPSKRRACEVVTLEQNMARASNVGSLVSARYLQMTFPGAVRIRVE